MIEYWIINGLCFSIAPLTYTVYHMWKHIQKQNKIIKIQDKIIEIRNEQIQSFKL